MAGRCANGWISGENWISREKKPQDRAAACGASSPTAPLAPIDWLSHAVAGDVVLTVGPPQLLGRTLEYPASRATIRRQGRRRRRPHRTKRP